MIKKLIMVALLASELALVACNTLEGAGEDVESVGDAVKDETK